MTSMVEKVARAIYEKRNGKGCTPWAKRGIAHKVPYFSDARAAIEAMLPPEITEDTFYEIEEAAAKKMRKWERGYACQDIRIQHSVSWWIAKEVEARMRDAALSEESTS